MARRTGGGSCAPPQEVIDGQASTITFPLVVWQTGSRHPDQHERERSDRGARPTKKLGGKPGANAPGGIPNDHVNMSQSSKRLLSDRKCIYLQPPTGDHPIPVCPALTHLHASACSAKARRIRPTLSRSAATHLQDATTADARPGIFPATRRQEMTFGPAKTRDAGRSRHLYPLAPRAATAGRPPASIPSHDFAKLVRQSGSRRADRPAIRGPRPNKFEALASHDAIHVRAWAAPPPRSPPGLFKDRQNDIRPCSASGPALRSRRVDPARETSTGSSIMPGKVNPTPVRGRNHGWLPSVSATMPPSRWPASQGHLELNVYKPVIALAMLQICPGLLARCGPLSFHRTNGVVGIHPRRGPAIP